jgi:hypothetical protein
MFQPHVPDPARANGGQLSLRSTEALAALYRLTWDHGAVHQLASTYQTWEQLAAAGPAYLAGLLGPKFAALAIPSALPAVPELPEGVRAVSRYAVEGYPGELRMAPDPPCLLYMRGELPTIPAVAIGGGEHPTPQGVEIARSAALAAAANRTPVVVQLVDGVSVTALRSVVDSDGVAVVVVAHGLDQVSKYDGLLARVVELGGAVLTEVPPGVGVTARFAMNAARIVVALGTAVVLAEVGRHVSAGAAIARAAVTSGRYLIVPSPQQAYIPECALGLRVLTETRSFSPGWYGTSPRLEARVGNGLAPADAVVTNQVEIARAIKVACQG